MTLISVFILFSCSLVPSGDKKETETSPILMAKFSRPLKELTIDSNQGRVESGTFLTEEDLGAIYEALLSANPLRHTVMNRDPLTYCEVCGRKQGLGDQNH